MTGEPKSWALLNPQRIEEQLKAEVPAAREAVLSALEELLRDPLNCSIPVHPLRGQPADRDPRVLNASLPGGWVLSFELFPYGLPPLGGKLVKVRAFVRLI